MDSFQIWLNGKKTVVMYDEYYELLYNYMNMVHELKELSEG